MMATWRLPPTVLRSSGEWPWTSALGLWTRRNSAGNSNASPVSNATVSAALSLRSLNSVGQAWLGSEPRSGADAIVGGTPFAAMRKGSEWERRPPHHQDNALYSNYILAMQTVP